MWRGDITSYGEVDGTLSLRIERGCRFVLFLGYSVRTSFFCAALGLFEMASAFRVTIGRLPERECQIVKCLDENGFNELHFIVTSQQYAGFAAGTRESP